MTRLRWDDRSGELLDADTVFNVDAGLLGNRDIFPEVAMHQLGHVMGLDRSDACGNSGPGTLMQSFFSPSAARVTQPTADDIAGAMAIYRPCTGDCDRNGRVAINELVLGVNIALDVKPLNACPAFVEGAVDTIRTMRAARRRR